MWITPVQPIQLARNTPLGLLYPPRLPCQVILRSLCITLPLPQKAYFVVLSKRGSIFQWNISAVGEERRPGAAAERFGEGSDGEAGDQQRQRSDVRRCSVCNHCREAEDSTGRDEEISR